MSGNTATPLQQPTSAATEFQALQFMIQQRLLRVQTAILVQVQAVSPAAVGELTGTVGTVDVLPLVDQVDGAGNTVPHVTLYARPYVRVQGGVNAFICDPQVGDIGLMVFCSRDISSVISSKEQSPPASARLFNYADGLYLGGYLNDEPENYVQIADDGTINMVSTVKVVIQAPAGEIEIQNTLTINAADIDITTSGTVNANGAIISHAGEVTDALGKVLGTHEHSGVSTGSSNTGPPV